jgi:hypothetical protein
MKLRSKHISAALLGAALLVWWLWRSPTAQIAKAPPLKLAPDGSVVMPARSRGATNVPPPNVQKAFGDLATLHTARQEQIINAWINQKNGRIDFWGIVVDQDNRPLPGVEITLEARVWTLGLKLGADFPKFSRTSGPDGRFELTGLKGDVLDVMSFSKPGYRQSMEGEQGRIGFSYHGSPKDFVPDPANPVVLRLWKEKGAERLLSHQQNSAPLIPDGSTMRIDLISGRQSANGAHLALRLWRDPLQIDRSIMRNNFSWRMEISAPGGGLQWRLDPFGFEAPESGYEPTLIIGQTTDDPDWISNIDTEVYIRTAQGYYCRVHIELNLSSQPPPCYLVLSSFLNPSGSRNLEYQRGLVYTDTGKLSSNGVFQAELARQRQFSPSAGLPWMNRPAPSTPAANP